MISVIIPIYNSEKYLRECLDSVFNQNIETPYEVVGVVCPSTDHTKEIVEEYRQKYSNFVVIETEDAPGPAISRFKGIDAAKGKYITFLDSDDRYHPDFLKTLRAGMEEGYDIVNCNFYVYENEKAKKYPFSKNKKLNSVRSVKSVLWDIHLRNYLWNKMFRRDLFTHQKIFYPKRKDALFEDAVILFSMLLNIDYMKTTKKTLTYYRVNPNSLTKSINKERFNYHLYTFALLRHLCDLKGPRYVKVYRKSYLRSWWSLWYDASLLKEINGHGPFKHMRMFKPQLKKLKSKKPLPVEGEVWESYIKECLL